jgi:hypothetical protein
LNVQRLNHNHSHHTSTDSIDFSDGYQKDFPRTSKPYKPSGIENIAGSDDEEEEHHRERKETETEGVKKNRSFRDVSNALISLNRLTRRKQVPTSPSTPSIPPPPKSNEQSIDEIIAKKFMVTSETVERPVGKYELILNGWSKYFTRNFFISLIVSLLLIVVGFIIEVRIP